MLLKTLATIILVSLLPVTNCFTQGEAALPFLLISPYTEANGMGEVSVANRTDDPLALVTNPAHLAMQIGNGRLSFGYNHSDLLPGFGISDLYYRTYAITAGLNLNDIVDMAPTLTVAAGYSRIYLNLGKQIITSPEGPEPVDIFNTYESSDQFTLSAGIDYWIRAAAGITFKSIHSNLSPFFTEQETGAGQADVNSYDIGFLLNIPVADFISRFQNKPLRIGTAITPIMDFNFGVAFNNLGDKKVIYIDADQGDPLPRYARIGVGIELGFLFERDENIVQPLSLKWTREANDILVRRYPRNPDGTMPVPSWKYRSGLGDIHFLDEVILGSRNPETIMKSGWELNFLEIVYIRSGKFREHYSRGNRNFNTEGYSLRFAGLAKLFNATDAPITRNRIVHFILNHIDARVHYSMYTTVEQIHPLDGTKFHSIVITVYK